MGRFLTFVAIAVVAASCVYNTYVARSLPAGNWGFSVSLTGKIVDPRVLHVARVFPHSPAARADIRPGDTLRALTPRFFSYDWPSPGARMNFEVTHGGATRVVTLIAQKRFPPASPTENILFAMEIAGLLLASLLAWRRWNDPVARPLMLYLVLQSFTLPLSDMPGYVFGYIRAAQVVPIFLGYAALIRFTAIYPATLQRSRLRRQFAIWAPALTLVLGVIFAVNLFALDWFNFSLALRPEYRYASILCADVLPLAGLVLGALSATAADRSRLAILIGFFLASITGPIAYDIILSSLVVIPPDTVRPLLATLIIMDAGFVYMILRQRMFDIGFVLNRAAIYAVLTTIFVPLFALLEWLAERYVSSQNRTENVLVQAGIILVLFLSIRRLQSYVERFVDRWLFRERHENENALRDFARHVTLMTDPQAVAEQAALLVRSRTDASWAALYSKDDTSTAYVLQSRAGDHLPPPSIAENDLAVAAMRADRLPVDHIRDSALPDALALPLIAHGTLVGFLACGPKNSGETYAPDEREALTEVARSVGAAFDGLRLIALENEVARLRAQLALQV